MPAIPSFINNYKSGWKSRAAIKSTFSRFGNRNDASSPTPPPTDANNVSNSSPSQSTDVLDIKDDRSSLDFDGGRPDAFEIDMLDKPRSPRPSSDFPPSKLEINLPPELRLDWLASASTKSNPTTPRDLDQYAKDTLAGKIMDDHRMVETLEDTMSRHVDSDLSRYVAISGVDIPLPEMSSPSNIFPTPLSIPGASPESDFRKSPRDSLSMLTSRLSFNDTPISSALSGTTLARALISNTYAMPIDPLSTSNGDQVGAGLTRSDSAVLPRDSLHNKMFSIAPDAPPLPPNAETQYVAPKVSRAERRRQMKRRSSTGSLNTKSSSDHPSSIRTSLNLSPGTELILESFRPWSFKSQSDFSPVSFKSPDPSESTTPPIPAAPGTATSDDDSFTLPASDIVRRLPDPQAQSSNESSPPLSGSGTLDTKGLEDVLDYYNLGDSPPSETHLPGMSFRPGISPIMEETSSQLSPSSSLFRNEKRESKRLIAPIGGRSPRSRGNSLLLSRKPSDVRSSSRLGLHSPTDGSSEHGSLKSSPSIEPQRSDSRSSHGQGGDGGQPGVLLQTVETSSLGEESQRSNDDNYRRGVNGDDVLLSNEVDVSQSVVGRITPPESSNPPVMDFYAVPTDITNFNQSAVPPHMIEAPPLSEHTSSSSNNVSSSNLSVSVPQVVRSHSPSTEASASNSNIVSGGGSLMTVEESDASRHVILPHLRAYNDEYLNRDSTISIGSPPPYYEVVNQGPIHHHHHHHHHPSIASLSGASGPESVAGPSRLSGEWSNGDSRRDTARLRTRPRPPLPIGPRRPFLSSGSVGYPDTRSRTNSFSQSQLLSRPPRLTALPSPKFQIPSPKWRGHTMDAARWTFKQSQLQSIISTAIRQSSEASLIRLVEPEVLENDIPAEVDRLEALRVDIKTRYKLLARRKAVLFENISFILTNPPTEEGSTFAHRQLEELSDISATLDNLAEELHSADIQLAQIDNLAHVHTSSALAVALRKLNANFLKQVAENENLGNELMSIQAERDEAWIQAERIAVDLDTIAESSEQSSPLLLSNRSSRISAHRKSQAFASKAGLNLIPTITSTVNTNSNTFSSSFSSSSSTSKSKRRRFSKPLSLKMPPPPLQQQQQQQDQLLLLPPHPQSQLQQQQQGSRPNSNSAFGSTFVTPGSSPRLFDRSASAPTTARIFSPTSASSTFSPPLPSSSTKATFQIQDDIYAMLGINNPAGQSLRRSRSWKPPSPQTASSSSRYSINSLHPLPSSSRPSSLPRDSTLAQVSNAMAADRNAMLFTIEMLSATPMDRQSNRHSG